MNALARLLGLLFGRKPMPPTQPPAPAPPSVPIFVPGGGGGAPDDDGNTPIGLAFALVNQARLNSRLAPFRWDTRLEAAAVKWAGVMELHGRLDHEIEPYPKLHERAYGAGYPARYVEEVIIPAPDAKAAVEGWLDSKSHRRALLSPNAECIGIGRAGDFWCGVIGY